MKRFLLIIGLALVFPAAALAHANLVRTEPTNGAVLAKPPVAVRVVFDDRVRVGPGIEAIRNGGASVLAGKATVVGARTLVVPLHAGLADGDYSVRWSIISDDGHLESGVLAFAVGVGRPPPLATLSPSATGPTADTVGARVLLFAGLLGAVGIALFSLAVRDADAERVALVLATACALAAAGAADEVHRVGLATRDGRVLGVGFIAAVIVATIAAGATLDRRALRPAAILALPLVVVPSLAGHALDPGLNHVNVVADVLHVLGASAWVGALLGIVLFGRRDARLAVGGIALLGATGVVRASYELTAASQLWDIGYGRTLLVKTALLVLAVALAVVWRRSATELLVVAVIIVAVSVLVQLRPGRNAPARVAQETAAFQVSPPPPAPPRGAIVLARELGSLGVVLASQPERSTVLVLSPAGGGLSGLDVRVDGHAATACGHGCYTATRSVQGPVPVAIVGYGQTTFAPPEHAPAADALVRALQRSYRALGSVVYRERLASDPTHAIETLWRLEKPDKIQYTIAGGPSAVVIGTRRWDSDGLGKPFVESPQTVLPQPAPQWNFEVDAHVVAQTATSKTITFADPTIPAYFTLVVDTQTMRLRVLRMTASSHFMTDRYVSFNGPQAIRPPR